MALAITAPKPARWMVDPRRVVPGHRWVWQMRPNCILPFWEHASLGDNVMLNNIVWPRQHNPGGAAHQPRRFQIRAGTSPAGGMAVGPFGPHAEITTANSSVVEPHDDDDVLYWERRSGNDFTMLMLLRYDAGASTAQMIRSNSAGTGSAFIIYWVTNVLRVRWDSSDYNSSGAWTSGEWATLAITWTAAGTQLDIYKNGVRIQGGTSAGDPSSFVFPWIGAAGFAGQDFSGAVGLYAQFDRRFTPEQVRQWSGDPFGFLRPMNPVVAAGGGGGSGGGGGGGAGLRPVICVITS